MVAPDDMRTMEPDKLRRVQSLLKGTDRLMQQIGACAHKEAHIIAFRFDPIDLGNRDPHQFGLVRHPEFFGRSEEHTSELQSLMRISYAVFCLTKKNSKTQLLTSSHSNTTSITYVLQNKQIHSHNTTPRN